MFTREGMVNAALELEVEVMFMPQILTPIHRYVEKGLESLVSAHSWIIFLPLVGWIV
jgi:hypothetical protein